MQPAQQPPMGAPPYYGYAPGAPMMVPKRLVFAILAFGVFLVWVAQISLWAFDVVDLGTRNFLQALFYTGAAIGLGGSIMGALGSTRTDGYQNLGLLVLAGFFLTALVLRF